MRGFLIGLILGVIALPIGVALYLRYGHLPVAVTDPAFPQERAIVSGPLEARIDKEMPHSIPIEASPVNLLLGAQVYRAQCASCHGLYGHDSDFAAHMFPEAPQLWAPHGHEVVGVSDDPPGETFWKVKYGIRLSGMPAYAKVLSETQMWQVSLLLAHANEPQPDDVMNLLKQPLGALTDPAPATGPAPEQTHMPASALQGPPAP
jgi:mono/diheme cytochrome c family protein